MFKHLKINQIKKIGLYFHGGLISDNAGIRTATDFTNTIKHITDLHPISFVWETGPFETIFQNIESIYQTPLIKKLIEKVVKVAGDKTGISIETIAGARGVKTLTGQEIEEEMNKPEPFADYSVSLAGRSANVNLSDEKYLKDEIEMDIEREIEADSGIDKAMLEQFSEKQWALVDTNKIVNVPAPGTRGILSTAKLIKSVASITYKVVKRHIAKRDHGFYPTIIEEVMREFLVAKAGVWVWGSMKKKAEEMWKADDDGTTGVDQHAGKYFLNKLKEYCATETVTIDLVGHSAGSIAICHLVKQILDDNINIQIRNILFMAPACRCDLFVNTILKNSDQFKSFRMFTMKEEFEIKDRCVPLLYTRSLLYMISGILEEDEDDAYILGMQRYLLDKHPYDETPVLTSIMEFLNHGSNRAVYSLTDDSASDGLRSMSTSHSGFNDFEEATMLSIAHILN